MNNNIQLKIATPEIFDELRKLSTESLIIWLIGKSNDIKQKLSAEDIVLECWLINPDKHSLRGYPQFPDSSVITKRIGEMKGKKGLLNGSVMGGYTLTDISKAKYKEVNKSITLKRVDEKKGNSSSDRTISSLDESPFKRLLRTPAYQKFKEGKTEQIVESDFLYFYGINWQTSKAVVQGKMKNVDTVVSNFADKDKTLKAVRDFLNSKFENTKQSLIK